MADLVAVQSILYGHREYEAGEVLPSDSALVKIWMESGSAVWRETAPPTRITAKPVTAAPGLPGQAVGGGVTGDDLVGRISRHAR